MDRVAFEDALKAYEDRFNSMMPEMEPTIRDSELGSTRCFTGKPVEMGGTDYDVEGIAGLGVSVAAETWLEETGQSPSSASIAVQGAGAMGAAVCRYAVEAGMTLRFLADPRLGGCWQIESEFDGALRDAVIRMDFDAVKAELEAGPHICMDLDDVLVQAVDILFPCAAQYVIDADNVDTINAKAVVEGANNPCTNDARSELYARGVTVVPDFIAANVELEWVPFEQMGQDEAMEFTRTKVSTNVRQMLALADSVGVDPVRAGQYLSYQRVFGEA